jgi:hypothetical protein
VDDDVFLGCWLVRRKRSVGSIGMRVVGTEALDCFGWMAVTAGDALNEEVRYRDVDFGLAKAQ